MSRAASIAILTLGNQKPSRGSYILWASIIVLGMSLVSITNTRTGAFGAKMLWLSDHDALKADRDDNNINTSRNILMTGGGENLDDIMSSNHHDLYYRWKDGLNFTQYLDVLENISKTDLTTAQRAYGPYIVLIRKGDGGDIRIYTHMAGFTIFGFLVELCRPGT